MISDLEDFISHLGEDEPSSRNNKIDEIWKELEDYIDKADFDIDEFLNVLLPNAQTKSPPTFQEYLKQRGEEEADKLLKPSCQLSVEQFTESFAMTCKINENLRHNLKLDLKDKSFLPTELLLSSIRRNMAVPNDEHQIHTSTSRMEIDQVFEYENDLNCFDHPTSDFSTFCGIQANSIIPVEVNWVRVLEDQNISSGVTVDSIVQNIMENNENAQPQLHQNKIYHVVSLLLKVLNDYIDLFIVEFADNRFFDIDELNSLSRKLQEDALSISNIKDNSQLLILGNWIRMVTQDFIRINDQRLEIEEKVSQDVIDQTVQIYKKRLESDGNKTENLRDVFCEGFLEAYANCGTEFKRKKVAELEKRLEKVNEFIQESSAYPASARNDTTIPMQFLLSEYTRNINQKGLQCASISTLEQFDDVNKNCVDDIQRNFEKRLNEIGVTPKERNNLTRQFQSSLNSESQKKRLECKAKLPGPVTGNRLPSSSTRSHAVGIHFGFESLSVHYFDESHTGFRNIYGPSANLVSFAPEGVFIGQIPPIESSVTFDMGQLLTILKLDALHDTKYYGKFRLEAVIASILMLIDKITKLSLHTTSPIKYAIAIPSCLDTVMQGAFVNAMKIGKIDGNLVREQCALTTYFLRENHQLITKNWDDFLITIIEDSLKSCDYVLYNINKKMITVSHVEGYGEEKKYALTKFFKDAESGFERALDKIKEVSGRRYRFIVCCPPSLQNDRTQRIKNKFSKSKVHIQAPFKTISNGAALLSSIGDNSRSSWCPFELQHLASIQIKGAAYPKQLYRFNYCVRHEVNVLKQSSALSCLMENQSREFESAKATAKKILLGKTKDVEESQISEQRKKEHRKQLEKDLKSVEEELTNVLVVQKIVDPWRHI